MNDKQKSLYIYLIGLLLIVCWAVLFIMSSSFGPDSKKLSRPVMEVWGILSFIGLLYLVPIYKMKSFSFSLKNDRNVILFILGAGLFFRGIMIPSTPILENDFQRYFFDGNLILTGEVPYEITPKDYQKYITDEKKRNQLPERFTIDEARASIKDINHPHIRTIYPPVSQALFTLTQAIKPWDLTTWKGLLFLLELGLIFFLYKILIHLALPLSYLMIWWWNPVVIKEFYNSAHMDLILLLPLIASIWFFLTKRSSLSGGVLAVATGAKIWPILLTPFLVKGYDKKNLRKFLIAFTATLSMVLLPLLFISYDQDSGFVRFGKFWAMNDALFNIMNRGIQNVFQVSYDRGFQIARMICVALVFIFLFILSWKKNDDDHSNLKNMIFFVSIYFILLPTQFPWYYTWLLLFLVINPIPSLLAYSCLIFTYYLRFHFMYRGDAHIFDNKIALLEHGIVYALCISELWKHFQEKGKAFAGKPATK